MNWAEALVNVLLISVFLGIGFFLTHVGSLKRTIDDLSDQIKKQDDRISELVREKEELSSRLWNVMKEEEKQRLVRSNDLKEFFNEKSYTISVRHTTNSIYETFYVDVKIPKRLMVVLCKIFVNHLQGENPPFDFGFAKDFNLATPFSDCEISGCVSRGKKWRIGEKEIEAVGLFVNKCKEEIVDFIKNAVYFNEEVFDESFDRESALKKYVEKSFDSNIYRMDFDVRHCPYSDDRRFV